MRFSMTAWRQRTRDSIPQLPGMAAICAAVFFAAYHPGTAHSQNILWIKDFSDFSVYRLRGEAVAKQDLTAGLLTKLGGQCRHSDTGSAYSEVGGQEVGGQCRHSDTGSAYRGRARVQMSALTPKVTKVTCPNVGTDPEGQKLRMKSSSTRAAISASSAVMVSSGLWLMPPLPQRVNSMATSVIAAIAIASWPAPDSRS